MPNLEAWLAAGERVPVTLRGVRREIFVRTAGDGPWCTLLHGFPTSAFDWHRVFDALCIPRRVLAFDFLGFGDSDKPADHDYSIHEQADLTEQMWARSGVESTALVVHDYAVSVAQELLARSLDGSLRVRIERVIFMNGGLYPELHRPLRAQEMLLDPEIGPKVGELMTEETFAASLRQTYSPSHQPSDEDLSCACRTVSRRGGAMIGYRLIRYITDRQRHRDRWVAALETSPVERAFIWGMLDPVSGAHMAERIAERLPDAELIRLDDVAHWPQLEAPDRVAANLMRMLE